MQFLHSSNWATGDCGRSVLRSSYFADGATSLVPPGAVANYGRLNRSRPSFVNYVEGRFRGSPETSEPGRSHHLSDACLAGLCAQAESHFLGP
jgi:hypothetical protein